MAGVLDDSPAGVLPKPPTPVTINSTQAPAPTPAVAIQPATAGPAMRDFADVPAMRRSIYDGVLNAARGIQPVQNTRHTLQLSDVDWADPEDVKKKDRKRAILRGETLGRRLRGTWRLVDNATGATIDERKTTLATVPVMTDGGTFVLNGTEYTLANQMRLRPGIFTRHKHNGEVESHVNILPGKGVSHRYTLDPEKSTFKIGFGQAQLPLLPVLRAMGATEMQLREAWGDDVLGANLKSDDPRVVDKLVKRLIKNTDGPDTPDNRRAALAKVLGDMHLDPEVTKRTLGTGFDRLSVDSILSSTKRILAVHKGEQEPDDRDALAYQNLLGPEDLFAERLRNAHKALRPLLWKATFKQNLSPLGANFLDKHVKAAITASGLGQPLEEVNPADLLSQITRVSRLGEGGIPSIDSVPEEARNVQPSHFGYVDPLLTPESFKVGVDSRLAFNARKGTDGKVYSQFLDPKSGDKVWKTPQDVADMTIAFPGELRDQKKTMVAALQGGKLKYVPRDKVDLTMPNMESAFNPLANMIPLKSTIKGQRVMMGARMLTQALPLANPQAPFVQAGIPDHDDRSFEEEYGKYMGAAHSDVEGQVVHVSPDEVHVKGPDGKVQVHELHNNLPFNRKTFLHNTPVVGVGDMVKKGDLLAKSNYTDDKGATALGLNMRVAYLPYKGLNFEDAIVISQAAAKRLSSEHMYQHDTEWEDNTKRGKKTFLSLFPTKFDRKMLDTLDSDGIVAPGTRVEEGHPLVLQAKAKDRAHNQIVRGKEAMFSDSTLTWDHHDPGVVTDVEKTDKGVVVTVKSLSEMKVGDKLSGRYGDKGVIAHIIPDEEMPRDGDGKPYEVLANPLGIITRTNPGQMVEAALGKIAERTGRRYAIKDFDNIDDMVEMAIAELGRHGIPDTEDVEDPTTQRKISQVFTGNRFFMKLHHTSESKGQGRGLGGYTNEETPAKGGETGSKRISLMDINALLSHGAHGVLHDAGSIRGQKNQDFWAAFMAGKTPPEPKVPLVYRKFLAQLQSAGINPVARGSKTQVMALTDRDIDQMAAGREVTNAETVDWKDGLKPVAGGLFDNTLTGGHGGNRWSFIRLHEPMPNPIMEEPIRRVLGLTEKKFEEVMIGKAELNGMKGPPAIASALKRIDVQKGIDAAEAEFRSGKRSSRDQAIRKLALLRHAQRLGIHPGDWVMNKVPVLPPAFRPVSVMGSSGRPMVSDPNYLYKDLFESNQALKDMSQMVDDVGQERLNLYKSFKAVTGLGDPTNPKHVERKVKGVLKYVFGDNPKFGVVQRKLLGSTVDTVGRAVITPNPELDMDQVGLPESKAWEIYKPFVIRRLARRGVPPLRAAEMVKNNEKMALTALQDEMDERPVILTRAPVLHRYGTMAFKPRLVKGETLQVPPLIVKGFAADFDGDAMNYHVPASDAAVRDAMEKMLPSRNLLAVKNFRVHMMPQNEYLGGLYESTASKDNGSPHYFQTKADMIRALRQGRIKPSSNVVILG
jgi:DNA-directed RNA polymerase subunit beta